LIKSKREAIGELWINSSQVRKAASLEKNSKRLPPDPTKFCKRQELKILCDSYCSTAKRFDIYSYIRLKILLMAKESGKILQRFI
jgi:hypothetical protein